MINIFKKKEPFRPSYELYLKLADAVEANRLNSVDNFTAFCLETEKAFKSEGFSEKEMQQFMSFFRSHPGLANRLNQMVREEESIKNHSVERWVKEMSHYVAGRNYFADYWATLKEPE